jgi:hypothetical protein
LTAPLVMSARIQLAVVLLAALFGAIYLPDLGHGFVKDDYGWIAGSRVQSVQDLAHLYTANVGFYRPLVSTTFAVDQALWGVNPVGYALTNLALFLADAVLLWLLARRLSLPPAAALFGVAAWAFNFHGVNMAVLWISGRTALLLCLFGLTSTLAFLSNRPSIAALLALAAMLCKEEAVVLPALFLTLDLSRVTEHRGGDGGRRILRTWPLWAALGVYGVLRVQSGAFGPLDAPDYYRFTLAPRAVLKNVAQYLDRGGTWPAVAAAIIALAVPTQRALNGEERRVIRFGVLWFVAFYAITVFLPIRSSLYALAPSMGSALAAASFAARAWRDNPGRFARVAGALVAVVALLLPVYRSRNHGLVEPSDLAAQSLRTIQEAARNRGPRGAIVIIDDAEARVTLNDAFGNLFSDAVHLFVGPQWSGAIVDATPTGASGEDDALIFELRDGGLMQAEP